MSGIRRQGHCNVEVVARLLFVAQSVVGYDSVTFLWMLREREAGRRGGERGKRREGGREGGRETREEGERGKGRDGREGGRREREGEGGRREREGEGWEGEKGREERCVTSLVVCKAIIQLKEGANRGYSKGI